MVVRRVRPLQWSVPPQSRLRRSRVERRRLMEQSRMPQGMQTALPLRLRHQKQATRLGMEALTTMLSVQEVLAAHPALTLLRSLPQWVPWALLKMAMDRERPPTGRARQRHPRLCAKLGWTTSCRACTRTCARLRCGVRRRRLRHGHWPHLPMLRPPTVQRALRHRRVLRKTQTWRHLAERARLPPVARMGAPGA